MTFFSDGIPTRECHSEPRYKPRFKADSRRNRRKRARAFVDPVEAFGAISNSNKICNALGEEERQFGPNAEALPEPRAKPDERKKRPYRRIYVEADWTAGLSRRSANALRAFGIRSRQASMDIPERRLKKIPNIGRTSLEDIRAWLQRANDPDGAMHRSTPT